MKNISFILMFILLAGCKSNDYSLEEVYLDNFHQYEGYYKIISYKSDEAVDLNSDNIASYELLDEIDVFGDQDLEIKRNELLKVNVFALSLPRTSSIFDDPLIGPRAIFQQYQFLTLFRFENDVFYLKENDFIEDANVDYDRRARNVTLSEQIRVINSHQLSASVQKEYYDYQSKEWKDLNIKIIFEKN